MLYLCKWPNGDISFVQASSKTDAVFQLDDISGASVEDIIAIPDNGLLSINLKKVDSPAKDGLLFELDAFGEGLASFLYSKGIELVADESANAPESDPLAEEEEVEQAV